MFEVWDWCRIGPPLLPATPGASWGGILAKLGSGGPVQWTRGYLKLTDRPKGQNSGFLRSGRIQGSMRPVRRGSGPPDGPFEWSHSRFGRGRYPFSDPFFGSTHPKSGPEKSIALDQTGYGAIQRVPQGPPNRALPALYSPGSALSVKKTLFWPLGLSVSFRYPHVHCTGPPPPSLARIPPQLAPGVAGSNGGPIPHQFSNWFY